MNITNDIRTMLRESGWTQERLAREANIHPVSLSNLLNGNRKKSVIDELKPFVYGDMRPSYVQLVLRIGERKEHAPEA